MKIDINELLDSYNSNTLWDMARAAELKGTTGKRLRKTELLILMRQEYFKPERIRASYAKLSQVEKAVVNRLLLRKGEASTRMFCRELVRAGLATEAPPPPEPVKKDRWYTPQSPSIYGRYVNHIGNPDRVKSTIFEDIIARLTRHGVVFSADVGDTTGGTPAKLQFHPGGTLYIPPFVRQYLPEPEPLPIGKDEWQPEQVSHGDPQLLLRDLYLYWDAVRHNQITLIQSGFVGKRGLKTLNEALLAGDPSLANARQEEQTNRLYLLRQMLEGLKLLRRERGELRVTTQDRQAIPDFWQKTTAEQVKMCLAVWRGLNRPFRLSSSQASEFDPQYRQACSLALQAIQDMPPATWIEHEDLLLWLQDRDPYFLFSARRHIESPRSYGYYGSYYYGDRTKALERIGELEQAFVTEIVAGFLFELGLIELGFNDSFQKESDWSAFRLTPLGEVVLQEKVLKGAGVSEAAGQIIIQPNFQILALGPVPLNLLAQLDLFAKRQKVDRRAFEYQLSRESIYAAQQIGISVEDVQRFLKSYASTDLPQNVSRSLAEWGAHHERIVFRRGVTLLQAAGDSLLERLLAGEETGKHLAQPLGPAVTLVKSGRQKQVEDALLEQGLFPAVSGANPEAADKSVIVQKDGRVEPIHAVPSLHLRGRLARFSEETEDGGWQLTEKSIRQAGGGKNKVQTILDELHKLNRGRLSGDLVDQVKAWGGYYGGARVGTYTLIEFRDHEALAELQQQPELAPWLETFPAGNRAIAVVPAEKLSDIEKLLSKLGVKVSQNGYNHGP